MLSPFPSFRLTTAPRIRGWLWKQDSGSERVKERVNDVVSSHLASPMGVTPRDCPPDSHHHGFEQEANPSHGLQLVGPNTGTNSKRSLFWQAGVSTPTRCIFLFFPRSYRKMATSVLTLPFCVEVTEQSPYCFDAAMLAAQLWCTAGDGGYGDPGAAMTALSRAMVSSGIPPVRCALRISQFSRSFASLEQLKRAASKSGGLGSDGRTNARAQDASEGSDVDAAPRSFHLMVLTTGGPPPPPSAGDDDEGQEDRGGHVGWLRPWSVACLQEDSAAWTASLDVRLVVDGNIRLSVASSVAQSSRTSSVIDGRHHSGGKCEPTAAADPSSFCVSGELVCHVRVGNKRPRGASGCDDDSGAGRRVHDDHDDADAARDGPRSLTYADIERAFETCTASKNRSGTARDR